MVTIPLLYGPEQPAASGNTKQLIVLLHGLGADGDDLFGLVPMLEEHFPDAAFVSPHAPFSCDMSPFGLQWFSLQRRDEEFLSDGVKQAEPHLNRFIDAQLEKYGIPANKLAVIGFSQGTMTSLYTLPRRKDAVAGIVGFSGAMVGASRLPREAQSKPPVCLIHGDADPVVPYGAMGIAERALKAADIPVASHTRHGLAHGIDPEGLEIATRFLQKVLNS